VHAIKVIRRVTLLQESGFPPSSHSFKEIMHAVQNIHAIQNILAHIHVNVKPSAYEKVSRAHAHTRPHSLPVFDSVDQPWRQLSRAQARAHTLRKAVMLSTFEALLHIYLDSIDQALGKMGDNKMDHDIILDKLTVLEFGMDLKQ
jgi:hypothetical protein